MVDPKGYIMNTVSLSSMEQKMFTKVATFVKSVDDIKYFNNYYKMKDIYLVNFKLDIQDNL